MPLTAVTTEPLTPFNRSSDPARDSLPLSILIRNFPYPHRPSPQLDNRQTSPINGYLEAFRLLPPDYGALFGTIPDGVKS